MTDLGKYKEIREMLKAATRNFCFKDERICLDLQSHLDMLELRHKFLALKTAQGDKIDKYLEESDIAELIAEIISSFVKENNIKIPKSQKLADIEGIDYKKFIAYLDRKIPELLSNKISITIPFILKTPTKEDIHVTDDITISKSKISSFEFFSSSSEGARRLLNCRGETCTTIIFHTTGFLSANPANPRTQYILLKLKTLIMTALITNRACNYFEPNRNPKTYCMNISTGERTISIPLHPQINDAIYSPETISFSHKSIKTINHILTSNLQSYTKLRSSLPWLFDSYFSENTAHKAINISVAIESLFSDNSKDAVVKHLSSKFAYSLGKTYEERIKLQELIKKFYDFRSDIVHGRPHEDSYEIRTNIETIRILTNSEIESQLNNLQARQQNSIEQSLQKSTTP